METGYYLFTGEDPIEKLIASAKTVPMTRRWKAAQSITRAKALVRKAKPFRDFINRDDEQISALVGLTFCQYFDQYIDKGKFVAIPKDPSYDFVKYMGGLLKHGAKLDDKYLKKAVNLVLSYSDAIDAFVKAFHSIKMAEDMVNKLQTS